LTFSNSGLVAKKKFSHKQFRYFGIDGDIFGVERTNKSSLFAWLAVGSRVDGKRDILVKLCIFVCLHFCVWRKIDEEKHELI
jgi:hypothetical protein